MGGLNRLAILLFAIVLAMLVFGNTIIVTGLAINNRTDISSLAKKIQSVRIDEAGNVFPEDIKRFSSAELTDIGDIILNKEGSYDLRVKAVRVFMNLLPNENQVAGISNYSIKHLPWFSLKRKDDEIVFVIKDGIRWLYDKTNNDKLLVPFRSFYDQPECDPTCKRSILQLLARTNDPQNVPLYLKILKNPKATNVEKTGSVFGLAESGEVLAIPYLIAKTEYLFIPKFGSGNAADYYEAVHYLGRFSVKNESANDAIKNLLGKACQCADKRMPIYDVPENVQILVGTMEHYAGHRNLRFMEKIAQQECKYAPLNELIIGVLGRIGDENTIEVLEPMKERFSLVVSSAIVKIKNRLEKQRQVYR